MSRTTVWRLAQGDLLLVTDGLAEQTLVHTQIPDGIDLGRYIHDLERIADALRRVGQRVARGATKHSSDDEDSG